jgi:peptidylprolyl isomerase
VFPPPSAEREVMDDQPTQFQWNYPSTPQPQSLPSAPPASEFTWNVGPLENHTEYVPQNASPFEWGIPPPTVSATPAPQSVAEHDRSAKNNAFDNEHTLFIPTPVEAHDWSVRSSLDSEAHTEFVPTGAVSEFDWSVPASPMEQATPTRQVAVGDLFPGPFGNSAPPPLTPDLPPPLPLTGTPAFPGPFQPPSIATPPPDRAPAAVDPRLYAPTQAVAPLARPSGPMMVSLPSGLRYVDTIPGTGVAPRPGDTVVVHYTGKLTTGAVFDTTKGGKPPFAFQLGAGQVIRGWDEGLQGMHQGGIRHLVIPPKLGYGEAGVPDLIPSGATLIFDIELLEVRPAR